MGNICRSPAAQGIFGHLLDQHDLGKSVTCDSAGTIGYHEGHLPDSRMRAAAAKRGIQLVSQARKIKAADLDTFDLILTMDDDNYATVQALAKNAEERRKIRRFCDYCEKYSDTEVPDPYYGGAGGFEHVLDLLEDGCQHILTEALAHLGEPS